MAGKRTFKPQDWATTDKDGWATQKEFGRRELGERHPYASVYGLRWLFWLWHGYGWLKIGLPLVALWAIGHGGIPVASDIVSAISAGLWYLVESAAVEVWGYVGAGVSAIGEWVLRSLAWLLCTIVGLLLYSAAGVWVWKEWGWLLRSRVWTVKGYSVLLMAVVLVALILIGVLA